MVKHVNAKVKCFGCKKDFMTARLKSPDEIYDCPVCGHQHIAGVDEVNSTWIHEDFTTNETSI